MSLQVSRCKAREVSRSAALPHSPMCACPLLICLPPPALCTCTSPLCARNSTPPSRGRVHGMTRSPATYLHDAEFVGEISEREGATFSQSSGRGEMPCRISCKSLRAKVETLALYKLNRKEIRRHSDHASDTPLPGMPTVVVSSGGYPSDASEIRMVHTRTIYLGSDPWIEVIPDFLLLCIDDLASYDN